MKFVVDASVAMKWVLDEPDTAEAVALHSADLLAPELLFSECGNTLWRYASRGRLTASAVLQKLDLIMMFPVTIFPAKPIARRALEIALDLAHPAYDTLYLAFAEREGVRVVTADTRLLRQLVGTPCAHLAIDLQTAATN